MAPRETKPAHAARQVIAALRDAGHIALLAGGCVRDQLLGLEPKDYDVATDAPPPRVLEIFPKARLVGAKFGVVLVRKHGCDVEVATFRSDGTYSDGRHPDEVHFGTQTEDARRRDFTINGLFLEPFANRVIDHVNGCADLRDGIIRTIGDPYQRFAEDHLRMLRAVRFAARFGFQIESATLQAILELGDRLRAISVERIWSEVEQLLVAPSRTRGWKYLLETGLRSWLCVDWPADAREDELVHRRLADFPHCIVEIDLALSAALCGQPNERILAICHSLRLSNQLTRNVTWMIGFLHPARSEQELDLADLKTLMADPCWPRSLQLLKADLVAKGEELDSYHRLRQRAEGVPPLRIAPPPLLTGDDLLSLGYTPGPALGNVLSAVYRAQLNEEIHSRNEAVDLAKLMYAK